MVTKADRVDRDRLAEALLAVSVLGEETGVEWAEIVPVSALDGQNVALLADLL